MMNKEYFLIQAITALVPKRTNWRLDSDNTLTWGDNGDFIPPSNEEIEKKANEFEAAYNALEYQRQRASEYPSIVDQLDKIFHDGIDAWKEEIQAIKDKYPKV